MRVPRIAVCGLLLGCAPPGAAPARTLAAAPPVIERLEPASGPAGVAYPVRVTIYGTGFAPTANTVRLGPVVLPDVPSADGGTRIVVFFPKEQPGAGEVAPGPLLPGGYEVSVTTAVGTSAPAIFTLTPKPGGGR